MITWQQIEKLNSIGKEFRPAWVNGTSKGGSIVWDASEGEISNWVDAYDLLAEKQATAKSRIVEQANAAMQSIEDAYPEFEKKTWPYQKAEVEAWQIDRTAPTPTIDAIVAVRGNDRLTHLAKTAAKITAYQSISTLYAGERQRLEDLIDNETDWTVIQQINFVVV